MNLQIPVDSQKFLEAVGALPEGEIDLALTALVLATFDPSMTPCAGVLPERYVHHLAALVAEVSARHAALLQGGALDDVMTRLAALKHVLSDSHGYVGDPDHPEDPQNVNLIRVVDRRQGGAIALCVLYIHAARGQGWFVSGLDIPDHFVCRLEKDGQRVIFDPSDSCAVLGAPELRCMVKEALGPQAELSAQYYEPQSYRAILVELQNKVKFRQIKMEEYASALVTVQNLQKIAPQEYRLLLDAGVLYARTGQVLAAIQSLERYIEKAPHPRDRAEAQFLLRQLMMPPD